jgi:hypothetical protein
MTVVALTVLVGGCPGGPGIVPPLLRPDVAFSTGPEVLLASEISPIGIAGDDGLLLDFNITFLSEETAPATIRLEGIKGIGLHPQTGAVVDGAQIRMRVANVADVSDSAGTGDGLSKSSSGHHDTFADLDYAWTAQQGVPLTLRFSEDIGIDIFSDTDDPAKHDFPSGGSVAISIEKIRVNGVVINDKPIISPFRPVYEVIPNTQAASRFSNPSCSGTLSGFCIFAEGPVGARSAPGFTATLRNQRIGFDFVPEVPQATPLEILNPTLFLGGFNFGDGTQPFEDGQPDVGALPPALSSLPDGGVNVTFEFTDFEVNSAPGLITGYEFGGRLVKPAEGGVTVVMSRLDWQDSHQLFDGTLTTVILQNNIPIDIPFE